MRYGLEQLLASVLNFYSYMCICVSVTLQTKICGVPVFQSHFKIRALKLKLFFDFTRNDPRTNVTSGAHTFSVPCALIAKPPELKM